jgi:hypothetical protein
MMSGNGEHVVVHGQESSARCVSLSSFHSHALAGCGGSGGGANPAPLSAGTLPTPASLPSAQAWGGHFIETVRIGDVEYYGDALLTSDGAIRLYI